MLMPFFCYLIFLRHRTHSHTPKINELSTLGSLLFAWAYLSTGFSYSDLSYTICQRRRQCEARGVTFILNSLIYFCLRNSDKLFYILKYIVFTRDCSTYWRVSFCFIKVSQTIIRSINLNYFCSFISLLL